MEAKTIHNKSLYKFFSGERLEVAISQEPARRSTDVELEGVKFKLIVTDRNRNGLFNDSNDMMSITKYGHDTIHITEHLQNKEIGSENFYIEVSNQIFQLLEVDSSGNFLILNKVPSNQKLVHSIKLFADKLPCIEFETLEGNKQDFCTFINKGKYIYVEVWGLWCSPCIDATKKLKDVYELYKDKLEIISLHHDGIEIGMTKIHDVSDIKKYIDKNNVKWINGISTKFINTEIMQAGQGYPFGILFDSNGNLIKKGLHPFDLKMYLEKFVFKK